MWWAAVLRYYWWQLFGTLIALTCVCHFQTLIWIKIASNFWRRHSCFTSSYIIVSYTLICVLNAIHDVMDRYVLFNMTQNWACRKQKLFGDKFISLNDSQLYQIQQISISLDSSFDMIECNHVTRLPCFLFVGVFLKTIFRLNLSVLQWDSRVFYLYLG